MVVALGPGKFYGSSLPRPRYYTDVKLNDYRVDPPVPVLDPFLSWANEAHWSMGGLSFKHHRLQGRIEGSVKKLRAEREKLLKKSKQSDVDQIRHKSEKDSAPRGTVRSASPSPPPAPVAVKRRRLVGLVDEDEDERESEFGSEERENGSGSGGVRRRSARKLWGDFDRVATESGLGKRKGSPVKSSGSGSEPEGVASRTRGRRASKEEDLSDEIVNVVKEVSKSNKKGKKLKLKHSEKNGEEIGASTTVTVTRSSPRLVKRRLN